MDEAMVLGFGKNRITLTAEIEARFGRTLPDGFFETFRTHVDVAFAGELTAIPGIEELLAALPAPRCVASNSHLDRVRHALTVTRLLPLFDPHIFSASQVARGKPAPDLSCSQPGGSMRRASTASSSKTARSASRLPSRPACRSSGFAAVVIARPTMPIA